MQHKTYRKRGPRKGTRVASKIEVNDGSKVELAKGTQGVVLKCRQNVPTIGGWLALVDFAVGGHRRMLDDQVEVLAMAGDQVDATESAPSARSALVPEPKLQARARKDRS